MGKIALQLKATLENVTNLRPVGEDFRWYLKDWTDYDEKAQESVGIYEVTHQFVKC
ncbi:hypothetical protein H1C71_033726 [Ictidomys tridecemlineatus]|uniref:CXXC motif containing zinc binding protein n=1 Tax=Ictidomys tridecemlineatus TaxID=43179 RepID=UPI00068335E7|nr:CXXC motif containing zinc binding protein [Ictidomys tridecemlineatus]KAG3283198.1 hypothetical protein H1C71_033726 [Ictidomys tridecemlineatus]